ncbi:hypothetical protein BC936DRAFT_142260, partial [Jimgerdemannia flammicorona]
PTHPFTQPRIHPSHHHHPTPHPTPPHSPPPATAMDRLAALRSRHIPKASSLPTINITPANSLDDPSSVYTSEPDEISLPEHNENPDNENPEPNSFANGGSPHAGGKDDEMLSPAPHSSGRRHSLSNLKHLGKEVKNIETDTASASDLPVGKLQIDIISMHTNLDKIKQPQVRLRLGGQIYFSSFSKSATGDWNEGFVFSVSYHAQLFDSIDVSLEEEAQAPCQGQAEDIEAGIETGSVPDVSTFFMIRFISAGRREKVATPQLCNVATERGTRRLTTILPLYEYHSRLHILPHLRDKIKDAEQDDIENTSSPLQAPPSDLLLHEHYEALSFIAAQDHETEPWSFDSLYDHRQPTPPLIGSIRIRMRYAYQHPRIDQQDVDHWMPTLPDSASFLSIDPDDDDASSIMSDASEAESEVGSVYSELELADGDYHEREARSWDSDTSAGDNGSATTLVNEPPRRVEDLVRSDSAVQLEFETKLNEALDKSPRGRRERHPLDTADPGRPLHGGNADSRPSSRPSSRGGSRSVSPASKGGIDNGSQVSLTGSVLSRSISTASGRSPPHREGSISPSVIDLLQYGFSRRDADTRSVAGESVHSSSTDMSIRSGVFADKDFAKRWMMDSFEEVVMANPTMDWMIGMVVSPETRTLLRAVSKLASAFVS